MSFDTLPKRVRRVLANDFGVTDMASLGAFVASVGPAQVLARLSYASGTGALSVRALAECINYEMQAGISDHEKRIAVVVMVEAGRCLDAAQAIKIRMTS